MRFWKLSGAGNDFVLLTKGSDSELTYSAVARRLCDRRRGVGADGLLVVSRERGGVRVDYWNADGSRAFCGNGSRCAAVWAKSRGWVRGRTVRLLTSAGALDARLTAADRAEVSMPEPSAMRLGLRLKAAGRVWPVHFVEVGVPHAVVFTPDVEGIDVPCAGRALRSHPAFGKPGANVNFVDKRWKVRTYERGVEGETLACGSGLVAVAAVANALGKAGASLSLRARSGDRLRAGLLPPSLEGPATLVFEGVIESKP